MPQSVQKLIQIAFQTTIGLFLVYFFYEIASHLLVDFPFNLYEPEVVTDSWAVSNGFDLYPDRAFGPPAGLYAPFYHLVVAFLFQFLPNSLLTARLVSFLAIMGSVWLIWATIKELPKAELIAFFAILIWHPLISEFDLHAKPDSLAVFLGMMSVWFVLKKSIGIKEIVFAAVFSVLTVATKQSMLFVPVGIGFTLLLLKEWKSFIYFSGLFVVFSAFLWWIFSATLGPDLWFYVFVQPGSFQMRWSGIIINFWMIQSPIPWFLLLLSIPVYFHQKLKSKSYILLLIVSLLALPASVLTASKGGGLSNAYQPFFYFMSWTFLVMISQQWKGGLELEKWFSKFPHFTKFGLILLLWFTMKPNVPSILTSPINRFQQLKNYEHLADVIYQTKGTFYAPMDNYLSLKAGKPLRWSYKWQVETSMKGVERKNHENHISLALKSDQVVTITNNGWTSDTHLEQILPKNGFHKVESLPMGQNRFYTLWNK